MHGHRGMRGLATIALVASVATFAVCGAAEDRIPRKLTVAAPGAVKSIARAGDFNSDGRGDVVFGMPDFSGPAGASLGKVAVEFFTRAFNSTAVHSNRTTFVGSSPNGCVGFSVSAAGDVNGDSVADVVVGAPHCAAVESGAKSVGRAFVLFGHGGVWAAEALLQSLDGTNGFATHCSSDSIHVGRSVSSADVNGDKFTDVIIGANSNPTAEHPANGTVLSPGKVFVVFGHSGPWPALVDLCKMDATTGFAIESGGDASFGEVARGIGNINGDTYDDILVAPDHHGNLSYVIFGSLGPWPAVFSAPTVDGTSGFAISKQFTVSDAAAAGDVNNDGVADFVFGDGHDGHGNIAVVLGHPGTWNATLSTASLNGKGGFQIPADDTGPCKDLGDSVSGAFDFNGDGRSDFSAGCNHAGFVFLGRKGSWSSQPADVHSYDIGNMGYVFQLPEKEDVIVAGTKDVDGDAIDDFVMANGESAITVEFGLYYRPHCKNYSETGNCTACILFYKASKGDCEVNWLIIALICAACAVVLGFVIFLFLWNCVKDIAKGRRYKHMTN